MFAVLRYMFSFSFETESREAVTAVLVALLTKTRWWRTRFDNFPDRADDVAVVSLSARFQEYKHQKEISIDLAALADAAALSEAAASTERATRPSRSGAPKRAAAMMFGTTFLPGLIHSGKV